MAQAKNIMALSILIDVISIFSEETKIQLGNVIFYGFWVKNDDMELFQNSVRPFASPDISLAFTKPYHIYAIVGPWH